jgi:hypothetical protein
MTHATKTVNMCRPAFAHLRRWKQNFTHPVISPQRGLTKCASAESISSLNGASAIYQLLALSQLFLFLGTRDNNVNH